MNRVARIARLAAAASLLWTTACSSPSSSSKAKEPEPPLEPITGREAFYEAYRKARLWATDAQPLQVTCAFLENFTSKDGKCGLWRVAFVSPARQGSRTFTWSMVDLNDRVTKGVSAATEERWGGPTGQSRPFILQAFLKDSDAAYATAVKKSEAYLKKNPEKPVTYLMELTTRFPNPTWRVIWGQSLNTSDYSVFVDASTGEFLQTTR